MEHLPERAPAYATAEPALDRRAELSEFLRNRRARLKPDDVGLPDFGRHRRVPGLRREELAQLAGVSVAYYTRLEQGNGRNVSVEVLDAIARALRLSDAEYSHLTHLAKPRSHKKRRGATCPDPQIRPALQRFLDSMEGVPAYVAGRRSDVLGWNALAAALFTDWGALAPRERNWARWVFLEPRSREVFVEWEGKATDVVSSLRMDAGCYPDDPLMAALVGELALKSADFRRLWAAHDVKEKGHGVKRFRHPLVGELSLAYEVFRPVDDPELLLITYHPEPGSPSEEALRVLAGI
ncbi:helix-turn-helix domain-containing protein [Streptomyces uncialis]|uniref:helix-turn-helix domain-containing protein n=1 Tax=Streptomyces uncialis TaxID=1048205 RepID=UPI003664E16C